MTETRNKKVRVYETLKKRIINVELKPGLPINESTFAEDLGVSKTPVREALRQLERDGFVDSVPGRGSAITHITTNEIKDVFQIREIIETSVAARAALIKGNEELANIRDDFKVLMDSGQAYDEVVFEWGSFEDVHFALVRSLENEMLQTMYEGLMDRALRIRNHFGQRFTQRRFHDILTEHLAILNAVFEGNSEKASANMMAHLANASTYVLGL